MNKKFIQEILDDIYLIDPELKKQEKQLVKIINEFAAKKPETKFDENFAHVLKRELLNRVRDMENTGPLDYKKIIIFNFNFMKKLSYLAGGALICALLAVSLFGYLNKEEVKLALAPEQKLNLAPEIIKVDQNAFGALASSAADKAVSGSEISSNFSGSTEASRSAVPGFGGGGGGAMSAPLADKMIMPNPDVIEYKYIYAGEEFSLSEDKLPVYKKIINNQASQNFARLFNVDLGLFDLKKFKNLNVTNFNLVEDREYGYSIFFDFNESMVSISYNWEKWPRPDKDCRDEACFQQYRLTINDVPGDSTLIEIANKFLEEYKIDIANYGAPQVMNDWRRGYEIYEQTNDQAYAYIPETMTVTYPLEIDGKQVYDEYGNPEGLAVDVNIQNKKAAGARGLGLENYEASSYEMEKDSARIIAIAEKGGMQYYYPMGMEASRKIEIKLGTPKLELVRRWQYNQETSRGDNLYVPAYVFPIISESEKSYLYRQNIVVPLAKEILAEWENQNQPGVIDPMPLIKSEPSSILIDGDGTAGSEPSFEGVSE